MKYGKYSNICQTLEVKYKLVNISEVFSGPGAKNKQQQKKKHIEGLY